MRKSFPIALALVATLGLSVCSNAVASCDLPTQSEHSTRLVELRSLKVTNATEDATSAYARGDARLLGVYGYSVEVPGYGGNPYTHKSKIRMLDGTGDVFCTQEEAGLNRNAKAYARKYNEAMLLKLKQAGVDFDPAPDQHP